MQNKTLHEIVTEYPNTSKIFENHQLDFCCQGKQTLQEACQKRNIPVETLVAEIEKLIKEEQNKSEESMETLSQLSVPQLVEHIISKHHQFLRQHIPSAQQYLDKVARVHGDRHPELKELQQVTTKEFQDILTHIQEEEDTIFKILAKDALHGPWKTERKLEKLFKVWRRNIKSKVLHWLQCVTLWESHPITKKVFLKMDVNRIKYFSIN